MPSDAGAALRAELGGEPPDGLVAALSDAELRTLADVVRAAKRRQSKALEDAGNEALGHLPGLVRKGVERALR